MGLFQQSVLKKYLKEADQTVMKPAFAKLAEYFHNPVIQQNIRDCKEEEYQDGFLTALFVNVFGYTLKPNPDFNLTREFKNEKGARKADGAILKEGAAIGVIELKSTTTKDLESIRLQAFDYKANQKNCVYVITSNFEKVRFYINNAVDFEEFDLFRLNYEQFQLMWLCLAKETLLKGIPLAIKNESVVKEEDITRKIYVDYTAFKHDLYNDLVLNNLCNRACPTAKDEKEVKLTLFKKSQKLLDRFLFILFGEDRGLLPPNSISEILKQWEQLKELDEYKPLYTRYKKYFGYLNEGWKGKKHEIFAYNGGLFFPDEVLDAVAISDDVLYKHTKILTGYDFESEVDVNILGHIFENSLSEIEEVAAQIEGTQVDLKKSKRKKDGVFYTPKYITKYIVENTIGTLCSEKKATLEIDESEYLKSRKGRTTKKLKELDDKLTSYRNWLLTLTICDPACGSGAFLNQALDFLIREHRYIDELRAKLLEVPMVFTEVENSILENNIYGVDINEESVEIARLSLWLRTAKKGRKLTTLSNNIKCGNSLIDDSAMAGEKAFHWPAEFPEVFRKKEKKAWHITTATHNSRYSQRMFDNYVKRGEPVWLGEKEELIVTETIANIAINDQLNIAAYNVCGDHVHMILVCEDTEVPKIVGKLKSMSARACNIAMGRTVPKTEPGPDTDTGTRGHAPLSDTPVPDTLPSDTPVPATLPSATLRPDISVSDTSLSDASSSETSVSDTRASGVSSGTASERGETQAHLWTQKFGCKEITSEEQLQNTIAYIQNNRIKHELPHNKDLQALVQKMVCSLKHAFRTEYTGGFDVVIGNPPYVQLQSMGAMSETLKMCGYETFDKGADLYCLFTERGFKLLKPGGLLSFIMPNKWMLVEYGKPLRKFLAKTGLRQILNFGDIQFFEEATTYVCIFVTQNSKPFDNLEVLSLNRKTYNGDFLTEVKNSIYDFPSSKFGETEWSIQPYYDSIKLEKMRLNGIKLKDLPISINYGIKTGFNDAFYIDDQTRNQFIASDPKSEEVIKPMVRGRDISPYGITGFEYLIGTFPALKLDIDNYPAIRNHLHSFGFDRLKQTGDKGARKKTNGKWFETQDSINYHDDFSQPKILYPNMTSVFPFMYDENGFFSNDKSFILTAKDNSISLLFLTAVLNSSLAKLWIWYNCPELQGGTREIRKVYFEHFPVPKANEEQTSLLANYTTERTRLTRELQDAVTKFQRTLQRRFNLADLSLKLKDWHLLSFAEFTKELAKKNVKLALADEADWEDYFNEQKQKAQTLKTEIELTDREIDRMVYELYGLAEEEILF